jgi:ubiquinone/menaquinone biosynthesis C-methylase UbiE
MLKGGTSLASCIDTLFFQAVTMKMYNKRTTKPLTIENRWDILYRDYPEVYNEFASVPTMQGEETRLHNRFDFMGKDVVDVGSGSGRSTFYFAQYAKSVIGVEPEKAMQELAEREAIRRGTTNVRFLKGSGQEIPLPDKSADIVTAITAAFHPIEEIIPAFIREATRVLRLRGLILIEDITPGWYGGELHDVIQDPDTNPLSTTRNRMYVDVHGFFYEDVEKIKDYGSLEKIIRTYGFIFGMNAINYLRKHNKTSITWRFRRYYKIVEKTC